MTTSALEHHPQRANGDQRPRVDGDLFATALLWVIPVAGTVAAFLGLG
ncbi:MULTISPECIES: hypothetical protein [Nocardioides]|uniref:Uncharacterized protein n=1 Tax=Nocardioides lianchengensis TaxID=1045774 RepID=A0A1G7A1H5_9ACTN|nr:hypothetical protein [Nocardioides lianchengensis]NYG12288.1 hypothetical protein [Nocardioides lianchengensis]SDE07746.1 hypothetical protein SAMN05421872_114109 [Nocardioides lianchengensis]